MQASDIEQRYLSHIGYDLNDLGLFPTIVKSKNNPYKKDKAQQTWAQVAQQQTSKAIGSPMSLASPQSSSQPEQSEPTRPNPITVTTPHSSPSNPTIDPTEQETQPVNDTPNQQIQQLATRLGQIERLHQQHSNHKQESQLQLLRSEIKTAIHDQNAQITSQIQASQLDIMQSISLKQQEQTKGLWAQIEDRLKHVSDTHNDTITSTHQILQSIATSISNLQTTLSEKITRHSDLINDCIESQILIQTKQDNIEKRYDRTFDHLTSADIPSEPRQPITADQLTIYTPPSPYSQPSKSKIPRTRLTSFDPMETSTSGEKRTSSELPYTQPFQTFPNNNYHLSVPPSIYPYDQLPLGSLDPEEAIK